MYSRRRQAYTDRTAAAHLLQYREVALQSYSTRADCLESRLKWCNLGHLAFFRKVSMHRRSITRRGGR